MEKQLIFIDDSGDPGFKAVSSSNFVMAAAVFVDQEVAALLSEELTEFRRSLGWSEACEFKFAKDRKAVVKKCSSVSLSIRFSGLCYIYQQSLLPRSSTGV